MTSTVRATYALDEETVRTLADLARRWEVSKSEALRKAIRAAEQQSPQDDQLAALDALQLFMALSAPAAESWADLTVLERRLASKRVDGQE